MLLETLAPKAAIICVPHRHVSARHHTEAEVIVDRRKLFAITVVERFERRALEPIERGAQKFIE